MARRTKAQAEKTRQRILLAALDLFAKKGYADVTFTDVASRIRLSKGAVYWHFSNKQELFLAVVEQLIPPMAGWTESAFQTSCSLDDWVSGIVNQACTIIESPSNRKCFRMLMRLDVARSEWQPVKKELHRMEMSIYSSMEAKLSELQQCGIVHVDGNVKYLSSMLGALWLGLVKAEIAQQLETDFKQTVRFAFSTVLNQLRA